MKEDKLKQEEKYMWAIVNGVKEKVTICESSVLIIIIWEMLYVDNMCASRFQLRGRTF